MYSTEEAVVVKPLPAPTGPVGEGVVEGLVYGGQQPLHTAQVFVFAASTTGNGGKGVAPSTSNASTSLLTAATVASAVVGYPITPDVSGDITNGDYGVTTDTNGGFKIPNVACTTGTQIYLVSMGGYYTATGSNTSAGLMAVLGQCTGTTISSSLGSNSRIVMNEVSTIAGAYATAGYASDVVHIGALSTSDTLAATGIAIAFANANQLDSLTYGSTTARTTTPNGNGTVPTSLLNTLANVLSNCVNSTGATSGACGNSSTTKGLFYYATSTGVAGGGTIPTETATAAINIAHYPANNVAAIFPLTSSTVNPFLPFLSSAPNDFSVSIVYTGGGLIAPTYDDVPGTLAIDASGNVWNANYSTTAATVSEFSPQGVSLATYAVGNNAISVTIDGSGNAWTSNYISNTLSEITTTGTVSTVSTGLGLSDPDAIAFDGAGNMFIANAGANTVVKATAAGVYTTKTTAKLEGLDFTVFLSAASGSTVGTGGLIYGSNEADKDISTLTNALTGSAEIAAGTGQFGGGGAVDSSGVYWEGLFPNGYAGGVARITGSGTAGQIYSTIGSTYYTPLIAGVAVDGSSNVWLADTDNGTVYELNETATVLSGSYGFVPVGNTSCGTSSCTAQPASPNAIAVDGAGDVWYNSLGDAKLRELIGIATPVATPIAYATAQLKLGARP